MRVALVHHQYKLKGGMETYFFNLIKGFNQQKIDVTAYVYKRDKQAPLLCKIKQHQLSWLPRVLRKYYFGIRLASNLQNQDIKISLMRALNQDIVVCGGTHLGFLKNTGKNPTLLDKIEIFMEKKSYQTAKCVLAHSNLIKEELIQDYDVPEHKIEMVFPPLDVNQFTLTTHSQLSLKQKFDLNPDKKAILFPSTGHKRKGLDILLGAMQLLPQEKYELVIAGNPPNMTAENIKYVGFVDNMPALYQACDVTALPSYYEPFGLVVIESLHSGTPVIVSNKVGAKDLITGKEGVILDHLSASNMAVAIEETTHKHIAISPDFASKHSLSIEEHINQIRKFMSLYVQEAMC